MAYKQLTDEQVARLDSQSPMTFDEFRDTASWCEDLGTRLNDACWENEPKAKGNVYLDCLYIEAVQDHWPENVRALGKWNLHIEREDWTSDDLESLERRLYDWALAEGYCEAP